MWVDGLNWQNVNGDEYETEVEKICEITAKHNNKQVRIC